MNMNRLLGLALNQLVYYPFHVTGFFLYPLKHPLYIILYQETTSMKQLKITYENMATSTYRQ